MPLSLDVWNWGLQNLGVEDPGRQDLSMSEPTVWSLKYRGLRIWTHENLCVPRNQGHHKLGPQGLWVSGLRDALNLGTVGPGGSQRWSDVHVGVRLRSVHRAALDSCAWWGKEGTGGEVTSQRGGGGVGEGAGVTKSPRSLPPLNPFLGNVLCFTIYDIPPK